MPFEYSEPDRRRRTGSGAGDSPAAISSGESPEETTVGFNTSDVFPSGQLVPFGSLGLEDEILQGFRSEMTRVSSSADCAFKPGLMLARNCFWESLFSAQRPSLLSSGESPEETQAGESPAPLPTARCRRFASSLRRILFGAEYPKGIGANIDEARR